MTPEQEERVRHALAAAADDRPQDRADAPIPSHVAARLDAVLADLVAERSTVAGDPDEAPARERDQLAARRRRRWPRLLVAAAVVSVLALTGGAVALRDMMGGGDSDATTAGAGSQADAGADTDQKAVPESAGSPGGAGSKALAAVAEPELRSGTLRRDVQRVVDGGTVGRLSDEAQSSGGADRPACEAPRAPKGADVVDVLLDGKRATLVLGRVTGGSREADVYSCADGGQLLASTVVRER